MSTTNREPIYSLGNVIQESSNSHLAVHKPKQRIDLHNQNKIFYLTKGNVSVYYFEGQILVVNIFAPEMICLEKLSNLKIFSHMRCVTDYEFRIISTQDAWDLLELHSLWPDAFDILSYIFTFTTAVITSWQDLQPRSLLYSTLNISRRLNLSNEKQLLFILLFSKELIFREVWFIKLFQNCKRKVLSQFKGGYSRTVNFKSLHTNR